MRSESNDEGFSYRQVSELSDATDEIQQESVAEEEFGDLDDYDLLVQTTQRKMLTLHEDNVSQASTKSKTELADEFLRNFFIKFGMKKTLD